MATVDLKYTVGFEDGTEQTITVGPYDPETLPNTIKQKIIDFNANFDSDTSALMVSKYGNKWVNGIKKAQIITTEIQVFW